MAQKQEQWERIVTSSKCSLSPPGHENESMEDMTPAEISCVIDLNAYAFPGTRHLLLKHAD